MPQLYDVLGIATDADSTMVKAAFRTLAKRFHPDLEGGDAARFKEVSHAYMTLASPTRRAAYDAQCTLERVCARRRLASAMATMAASFIVTVSSGMVVSGWLLGA